MPFQTPFTSLSDTDLVDDEERERLATHGIGTVEELADAIGSSDRSVAHLLGRSRERTRALYDRALAMLDPSTRDALAKPREEYATGALPPLREHRKRDLR